jgi:Domain of unknown function (DUF4279)
MAHISASRASLRIIGDLLDPEEITKLLGGSPTSAQKKGNVVTGRTTGKKREVKRGMWRLVASKKSPKNLDSQVEEILGQLTKDITVWDKLGGQFRLDLFCGTFMEAGNEGMTISSKTLLELGQRGIEMGLYIYGPPEEALGENSNGAQ